MNWYTIASNTVAMNTPKGVLVSKNTKDCISIVHIENQMVVHLVELNRDVLIASPEPSNASYKNELKHQRLLWAYWGVDQINIVTFDCGDSNKLNELKKKSMSIWKEVQDQMTEIEDQDSIELDQVIE